MIFFIVCKGVFYVAMRNRFIFTIARFFKCCGNHWICSNVVFTRFCGILRAAYWLLVFVRFCIFCPFASFRFCRDFRITNYIFARGGGGVECRNSCEWRSHSPPPTTQQHSSRFALRVDLI